MTINSVIQPVVIVDQFGNPIVSSDGINDSSGRKIVVGAAADGSAAAGINPVLVAGSDGANLQSLFVDVNGRAAIVGRSTLVDNNIASPIGFAVEGSTVTRPVATLGYVSAGDGVNWPAIRTPTVFRTATATAAGDTTVWTPAAGKKFRLMRYRIDITGQAIQAVAGNIEITLIDNATAMNIGNSVYVPAIALNQFGAYSSGWIDLGNGYLSLVANNTLDVNLSAALTAGELRIQTAGTEE